MFARNVTRWLGMVFVAAAGISGCGVRQEQEEKGRNHMKATPGDRPLPTGSVTGSPQPEPPAKPEDTCISITSGNELDFSQVGVGDVAERTVVLTNTCNYEVTISRVSLSGGSLTSFSVASRFTAPAALAMGGQLSFTLRFEPAEQGETEGLLVVSTYSTMTLEGAFKLTLRGQGVAP